MFKSVKTNKENNVKIISLKSFNEIEFGINRKEVLKKLGNPKRSFRKSSFSKTDIDDYGKYHIYYDENYNFEYIEIFYNKYTFEQYGEFDIYYDNIKLAKKYSDILKYFKTMYDDIEEDGNGFISKKGSIGVYIENDKDEIDSIGFGIKGYYK